MTIAIGAFAVGTILGAYQGVIADSERSWDDVAACLLIRLRIVEGADADPAGPHIPPPRPQCRRGPNGIRHQVAPHPRRPLAGGDAGCPRGLHQSEAVDPLPRGSWPVRRQMAVERGYPITIGDKVELNVDDHVATAPIDGVVYNRVTLPASLGGTPTFYTTRRHFADLTGAIASSLSTPPCPTTPPSVPPRRPPRSRPT